MKYKFFIFCCLIFCLCGVALIYNWKAIQAFFVGSKVEDSVLVVFLDIGQGDASYIRFPNGEDMLVDCGKDRRILSALGRSMHFFDRTIDYLLVTHPDLDHYGGCTDVLARYHIRHIIETGATKQGDEQWNTFLAARTNEESVIHQIDKVQTWEIASTSLHFLFPDKNVVTDTKTASNNTSIVFSLTYGPSSILFTADAEVELETYLVETYGENLDLDILKVGHHGSNTSSIEPFVDAVTPVHAVVSSGKENTYGHPSPRVLQRLTRAGSRIWRTDEQGDILVTMYPDYLDVVSKK